MKQYYEDLEIVGWGQDVSNASAGLAAEIERNHKQNFNIHKNVLFLLNLAFPKQHESPVSPCVQFFLCM